MTPSELLASLKGKDRILLIDADIVAFEMSSLTEEKADFGAGEITLGDPKEAAKSALGKCRQMAHDLWCDAWVLCFTGDKNFRYTVLPTYKGNRDPSKKPKMLPKVKRIMQEAHRQSIKVDCLEADDVMGILQTHPELIGKTIIATLDKDLKQIPGDHWNWRKAELIEMSYPTTELFFWYQVMIGDTADGYKGCPGIGEAKAKKLLNLIGMPAFRGMTEDELKETLWAEVYSLYLKKGLSVTDVLAQARVARMLRWGEVHQESWEPILWAPPMPSKPRNQ